MGGRSSKKTFTEWDLIKYSNMTNIPLPTVENIYKDFITATGNTNKMDKNEFRRLYKQMYMNCQYGNTPAPFLNDHDIEKMSDHVFEIYDYDGSGKLTFEEFAEIYLMLNHYAGTTPDGLTRRDRFNYILDQYDTTPEFITRERGQQIFNYLNRYNNWPNLNMATSNNDSSKPVINNWEYHWNKLDDGTGRVEKDKFLDYITKSNDYKRYFDPKLI
ncbi:unnamed protein product [Rotaria sordida]|uniref:EF-hand domain-containing protein n=1 Tax=Rotaria sordida TaxID=392033 RepID=A0A819LID1_9BILA|nr:unnamed protein product [Rotaria sordida]CAF3961479.1 unnamed protein product [Rotaria sordida]